MQEDGPSRLDRLTDSLAHGPDVVPVDHAEVGEAQLLEEHAGADEGLHRVLDVPAERVSALADPGDARHAALDVLAEPGERGVETQPVEVEL